LQSFFPVLPILKNYCSWEWQSLHPDNRKRIGPPGVGEEGTIIIETVPVSKKPPLYTQSNKEEKDPEDVWEVGLVLHNESTGRCLAYFPTLERITPAIEACFQKADILMVDGTFWSETELVEMGATKRDARSMGHLPISGPSGIAEKLALFPAKRKILIHINNSNPILKKDSMERHTLERLGFEIAYDGMEVEV
jgi:pyrroloquinoline quinone biosynthesis protein B